VSPAPGPVAAALAAGADPLGLEVAAHEVGHALCWRAAGFPIVHLVIRRGVFGGITDARCRHGRVWLDAHNVDGYLIGLVGGPAAQARFLTTHHRAWRSTARSRARGNGAADLAEFTRLARAHRTRLSVEAAWRAADRLLTTRAGALDRLTARLAATGRITGSAL
jgi:hypothetical protein